MKKDDFFLILKKNYMTIIIGAFALAALFLVAGMFNENSGSETKNEIGDYKEQLETRLCEFLRRMQGVGECEVLITLENGSDSLDGTGTTVRGIAVLCYGGANVNVKSEIETLLSRVFGIPQSKISIGVLKSQ